ncbi:MAG: glucosidase [Ktedonobacteraceae bacterium]
MTIQETQEGQRLAEANQGKATWRAWGSYLSERQWGTVREDYSEGGDAWNYVTHDDARSRAYRWGEDGIAGISDDKQRLCFALALWNGEDPILKERLFGLTNTQGNHGEDVKEYYFYLDNTPTHSYMKCLYKYSQRAFPYADLIAENERRKADPASFEYELLDTGVFANNAYFDVLVEYAKATPDDVLIQVSVTNRGHEQKSLHVLPTLWFRNTWSWFPAASRPQLQAIASSAPASYQVVDVSSPESDFGHYRLYCEHADEVLYTENDTNNARFGWGANASPYVKDGFHQYIVHNQKEAVNPQQMGTKAAAHYVLHVAAGETQIVRLRLCQNSPADPFNADFAAIFAARRREADEFYQAVAPFQMSEDMRNIQRQAFAGMLWCKQFYYYNVKEWLEGDPAGPPPPAAHKRGRNHQWTHLSAREILSMPDTWEYPWFAAWDLAFHTIPLSLIDPDFARHQLLLLTREWYIHPNGQVPAYEWSFDDANPPIQAWAAWRIYKIEEKMYGQGDREFLERIFQQLLFYYTWWLNRKDLQGNNLFQGGFLGLDNIGPFNRSHLPSTFGGYLDQSDGTSWMGMYCLNMFKIAVELAIQDSTYEIMASKFFLQFLSITDAMNGVGGEGEHLWDETDGFFYDVLHLGSGRRIDGQEFVSLKIRSIAGLVPLFAIEAIDQKLLQSGTDQLTALMKRVDWARQARPDLLQNYYINVIPTNAQFMHGTVLSLVKPDRLKRILQKMLDENELLSPHGIRSVSKYHEQHPFVVPGVSDENGQPYRLDYEPAESRVHDFGGNSNWRGPVWFPMNYLLIESLQKFHRYLGDDFKVECPTGSGKFMTLWEVATELSQRLISIFSRDATGKRPVYGGIQTFQEDPEWRDLVLFYEYFHGENGAGLGASHQTGWTGVVAKLIQQWSEYAGQGRGPGDPTDL